MDRKQAWPDLLPSQILASDNTYIAVSKPAGVPCQERKPGDGDDFVSRIRRYFCGIGEHDYLGVHQRLDADTSGVLLYTRDKSVNTAIASQFERHSVGKVYSAIVSGWTGGSRTLKNKLTSAKMETGAHRGKAIAKVAQYGQEAITHVSVLENSGTRQLLSLVLETGRTHQVRAQLAAVGCPIAGDELYGGEPSFRLMLHSTQLAFLHTESSRKIVVDSPIPNAFFDHLRNGFRSPLLDEGLFDDAIDLARERRFFLGRCGLGPTTSTQFTTAFRLINEAGDGFPEFALDVYGDHGLLHLYSEVSRESLAKICAKCETLGFDGLYVKTRPKQANAIGDAHDQKFAPKDPVMGDRAQDEFVIFEHGVPFLVRLDDGLSTGIFLDQRENRRRIRELAEGRSVLNLFAYTCAFSVVAALGHARETVSVDSSRLALDRGRANFVLSGLQDGPHSFLALDAFDFLDQAQKKKRLFDIVILDPPSYSSTRSNRFSTSSGDYKKLAIAAMAAVSPGGYLLCCSNHKQTVMPKLRRYLREAAEETHREVLEMKDQPAPVDYPPEFGKHPQLKSVLLRLG